MPSCRHNPQSLFLKNERASILKARERTGAAEQCLDRTYSTAHLDQQAAGPALFPQSRQRSLAHMVDSSSNFRTGELYVTDPRVRQAQVRGPFVARGGRTNPPCSASGMSQEEVGRARVERTHSLVHPERARPSLPRVRHLGQTLLLRLRLRGSRRTRRRSALMYFLCMIDTDMESSASPRFLFILILVTFMQAGGCVTVTKQDPVV